MGNDFQKQNFASQEAQAIGYGGVCDIQNEVASETLQSRSAENALHAGLLNQRLASIRGKLFGEGESGKDKPEKNPGVPPLLSSLHETNNRLLEALKQLSSILERL